MKSRDTNNLDGLLGPEEHSAAARRGYSRAAAARTARGGGGGASEDPAEARRIAILKHERRRAAAMARSTEPEASRSIPGTSPKASLPAKPLWRRMLGLLRRG